MTKPKPNREPPSIDALINRALFRLEEMIDDHNATAGSIKSCVEAVLGIDKSKRDIEAEVKTALSNLDTGAAFKSKTLQELEAERDKIRKKLDE